MPQIRAKYWEKTKYLYVRSPDGILTARVRTRMHLWAALKRWNLRRCSKWELSGPVMIATVKRIR